MNVTLNVIKFNLAHRNKHIIKKYTVFLALAVGEQLKCPW